MAKKQQSFETSLQRLEEIVQQLESGEVSLEDSVKVFEEGMAIYQRCSQQLGEAERKIEKLVKTEDGFQLELIDSLGDD